MNIRFSHALVLGALVFGLGSAVAQVTLAKNTTQKSDPFVVQAEKAYVSHIAAEKSGDVNLYKRVRSKAAVDEILDDLKKRDKSESDLGAELISTSRFSTSLDGFRFLFAEGREGAGRLFYRKDWKDGNTERIDFLGFVVRLENGQWKVDCAINGTGTKLGMGNAGKMQERTVEEVSSHRCVSLK